MCYCFVWIAWTHSVCCSLWHKPELNASDTSTHTVTQRHTRATYQLFMLSLCFTISIYTLLVPFIISLGNNVRLKIGSYFSVDLLWNSWFFGCCCCSLNQFVIFCHCKRINWNDQFSTCVKFELCECVTKVEQFVERLYYTNYTLFGLILCASIIIILFFFFLALVFVSNFKFKWSEANFLASSSSLSQAIGRPSIRTHVVLIEGRIENGEKWLSSPSWSIQSICWQI